MPALYSGKHITAGGCGLENFFLWLGVVLGLSGSGYLGYRWIRERFRAQRVEAELAGYRAGDEARRRDVDAARTQVAMLDAEARARLDTATSQAQGVLTDASRKADDIVASATRQAEAVLQSAESRAREIAGDALEAKRNAQEYERVERAMRNIIRGYGDEYLLPAQSLLDNLADEYSHAEAGRELKLAREQSAALIKRGKASRCDYVESERRRAAEEFVLDAFNGKVDSIFSRVRHDNFGKLEQQVRDAFSVVNFGGYPFRNARITEEYLASRLNELRWACTAQELKRLEIEEQRRIREQIREEEKARRDYERALRESAKEEELLRKAMTKAQEQLAAASAEQRAKFESQLAELNTRLALAEEKNRRALSMAQQTKRGFVYIISNVGSFGDGVYKIGLTRRLEPMDRIWELSDASVPFDFDVHAMILAEDAPALEHRLHKHFLTQQVNKVNHRKEFFRTSLSDLRREIELLSIDAKWTMAAEAREYRETLAIERAIEQDPIARERWINRQLELDPVSYSEPTEVLD